MTTKCHKTGHYLIENMCGVLVCKMAGRRQVFFGTCSRCGRKHELSRRELNAAIKENRESTP